MTGLPDDNVVLLPNAMAINKHLYDLFTPSFVKDFPDAWIEIAYSHPLGSTGGAVNAAETFSAFDLKGASDFAIVRNRAGCNVYVGPALRQGRPGRGGRATDANYLASRYAWVDVDAGYDATVGILRSRQLRPAMIIRTGSVPEPRLQIYFQLAEKVSALQLRTLNAALHVLLPVSDSVGSPTHVMRLNGTVNYPTAGKTVRGRVPEAVGFDLATEDLWRGAGPYTERQILECAGVLTEPEARSMATREARAEAARESPSMALRTATADPYERVAQQQGGRRGRDDDALLALLEASRAKGHWHNSIRDAIATMVGRGWEEAAIRLACASYCRDGAGDRDLAPLIAGAFVKFGSTHPLANDGEEETPQIPQTPQTPQTPPGEGEGERAAPSAFLAKDVPPRTQKPLIAARPFNLAEAMKTPMRQWVYGTHLIRKFGSVTVAPGGLGKSTLILAEALAMVTGKPLLGVPVPLGPMRVWLWNGEDPLEELWRRIWAACQHYGVTEEDIGGRLFVNSGRVDEITIATQDKTGTKIAVPTVNALVFTIRANAIDVVQVDPFVSCHRVSENDNGAIDAVAKAWTGIADLTNIAIELVHHIRKTGGAEATVEDARGAIALINAARSARVLNRMTLDDGEKLAVERMRYFRINDGKSNLAPMSDRSDWYHLHSVRLPNGQMNNPEHGDWLGVAVHWQKPDALDGMTGADFEVVARAIRSGRPDGSGWRKEMSSAAWVGKAVAAALGYNLHDKGQKAKVRGFINAWLLAGTLCVVDRSDEHRHIKSYVEVVDDTT